MDLPELNEKPTKRPPLLIFVAILSFIGSGLSALSNLFVYFNYDLLLGMIDSELMEDFSLDLSIFTNTDRNYFILTGLLNVVSFSGVRLMWRLRWKGFHVYSISQLLMLIVSTIYIYRPNATFPTFDLMLTLLFILSYFRMRDQMA